MDLFWNSAIGVTGVFGLGAFLLFALYRLWLRQPIFSKLKEARTYSLQRMFLLLVFLALLAVLGAGSFKVYLDKMIDKRVQASIREEQNLRNKTDSGVSTFDKLTQNPNLSPADKKVLQEIRNDYIRLMERVEAANREGAIETYRESYKEVVQLVSSERAARVIPSPILADLRAHALDWEPETDPSAPENGADALDLSKFPGKFIENVLLPVPSEIFLALDQLGEQDWKSQIAAKSPTNFSEHTDIALLLGAKVADGFIAVQARDEKGVISACTTVPALANAVGLPSVVRKQCEAIHELAKNGNWDAVRAELQTSLVNFKEALRTSPREKRWRNRALAQCVSLGGWLRGAQLAASVIGKNFSKERAELLYNPDVADYFNDALEEMIVHAESPATKLKSIADGVAQLREIMQSGDENLSVISVNEMCRILDGLVKSITTSG